ncbi:MAG: hypothetical protein U1D69_14155 [Polynucleobacter sp.]|nr:hypothetical protein [Polynucleobacter sp.]
MGNASHKRNSLDYKLIPPTAPRSNKSLCDDRGEIRLATAQALLRRGVEAGLVNGDWTDGWPRRVWSVDDGGNVWEAKLDSAGGTYHGYPLEAEHPFAQRVLDRIKAAQ